MAINSRTKGANFEREIGNLLQEKLSLTNPVRRILEQTRTKELPDLKMGRWCIECKRYGPGSDPLDEWWDQVIASSGPSGLPALIYKFNRKPIKVRLLGESLSDELIGTGILIDTSFDDFIELLKLKFQKDIDFHNQQDEVQ